MTLADRRGRPGAVLALAVLCAHILALQALRDPGSAATGSAKRYPAAAPHPLTALRSIELAPLPIHASAPPHAVDVPTPRHTSRQPDAPGQAAAAIPALAPAGPPPAPDAQPARIAPPMRLHYDVRGHSRDRVVVGRAELSWQHDGQRYEAYLAQDGEGLPRRRQHSAGRVTAQGLAPERYADRTRHEEAVHFERDVGHAIFSANRPPVPLQPGAQDRLSLLLQLGARIAARPQAYAVGSTLEVQTSTTRDALIWRFRVEGLEELQLPGGHQTTLRLVRMPTGEYEPRVEVWLAPGLDYAPVRMRLTQYAGDHLDYQWSGTDRR